MLNRSALDFLLNPTFKTCPNLLLCYRRTIWIEEVITVKVLGFLGSPRSEGSTRTIVESVLAGASSRGAETELYMLNELNFKGCQGCRKCKQEGACDLKDDMTPIYGEILSSDVMVIGSPVYMAYVTGQTKLFLDRLYAFTGPDQVSRVPQGKRCILVLTQGYSDTSAYQNLIKGLSSLVSRLGFEVLEPLVVGGVYSPEDQAAFQGAARGLEMGKSLLAN